MKKESLLIAGVLLGLLPKSVKGSRAKVNSDLYRKVGNQLLFNFNADELIEMTRNTITNRHVIGKHSHPFRHVGDGASPKGDYIRTISGKKPVWYAYDFEFSDVSIACMRSYVKKHPKFDMIVGKFELIPNDNEYVYFGPKHNIKILRTWLKKIEELKASITKGFESYEAFQAHYFKSGLLEEAGLGFILGYPQDEIAAYMNRLEMIQESTASHLKLFSYKKPIESNDFIEIDSISEIISRDIKLCRTKVYSNRYQAIRMLDDLKLFIKENKKYEFVIQYSAEDYGDSYFVIGLKSELEKK